jgi:hypothetical protein
MVGCLVHGGAGPRYLRVLLETGLSVDERIEVIAHELQHVREVIQAGTLNERVAMQGLFSRIGHNKRQQGGRQQEYETAAARQISATVARPPRYGPVDRRPQRFEHSVHRRQLHVLRVVGVRRGPRQTPSPATAPQRENRRYNSRVGRVA